MESIMCRLLRRLSLSANCGADQDRLRCPGQVEPEVSSERLAELEAMGFSRNKAVRALHGTGTDSIEQAVNWLVEHGDDADVDTRAVVAQGAQDTLRCGLSRRISHGRKPRSSCEETTDGWPASLCVADSQCDSWSERLTR